MFTQLLALFAFLAAANASAILLPETKVETVPVVKTNIHGPSGEITQEESLPVITHHEPTIVEAHPVVRFVPEAIHHEELSLIHPSQVVVPQEVVPIQPVVHHELPVVVPHDVVPFQPLVHHELPIVAPHEVPIVVKPHVPLVHPIAPHSTLIRAVPHTIPFYNSAPLYKSINGLWYY